MRINVSLYNCSAEVYLLLHYQSLHSKKFNLTSVGMHVQNQHSENKLPKNEDTMLTGGYVFNLCERSEHNFEA